MRRAFAATALLLGPAAHADDDAGPDDGAGELVVEEEAAAERTDPQATSATVTVIEVDASLPASSDVSTVVDSASGTTVQRLGGLGDWSGVSIRGSTLRQVQVVLDGIPLNPDGASAVNLSELPLWAFERVEIFRGNAPPELAAAPIGGVVHLRTGEGRQGTAASASAGSLRTGRATAMTNQPLTLGATPLDVLAVAEGFGTRGDFTFFADNGTEYDRLDDHLEARGNNDKRQLSTHLRLRLGDRSARLTLLEAVLAREEGLPGHANAPTVSTRLATTRSLTALSGDLQSGLWRLQARTWLLLRRDTYDDRQGEIGVGAQWNDDRFTSVGGLAHGKRALGGHVVGGLTLGGRLDAFGTTDLLDDAATQPARRVALTPTANADLRFWADRLTLSPVIGALILDNRGQVDPSADLPAALLAPTPRVGLLVRPWEPLALKANAGRYLRPPDFTELFGDRGPIIGNPELSPERGTQWDVGARAVAPDAWAVQGSVEVGHYWNSVQDLIVMVQNSQRTSVPVNLDDAWIQGVEAALTLRTAWLESQSNLTHNTSVNLSTRRQYANNQLPRLPTWETHQRTALLAGEWGRVGHVWSYTDGNYWDRTNFYRAAPRSLHSVFARVQPGPRWPALELDVLNVTDRVAQVVPRNPLDPADPARVVQPVTDFVGYPLPGRTLLVTLRYQRAPDPGAPG